MRSFVSPASSMTAFARSVARPGPSVWRKPAGAIGALAVAADAEAVQRAVLHRSEAFVEDLGPAYADLWRTGTATVAAGQGQGQG